ncbi:hypothetical protein QL285_026589 [Trifolium repens]|nr:hypothetical protein QL285_026589 [Trifolium repens]
MDYPKDPLHRLEPQIRGIRTSLPTKLRRSLMVETGEKSRSSSNDLPLTLLYIPLRLRMGLGSHSRCHCMHGISHLIHINLWYYRN